MEDEKRKRENNNYGIHAPRPGLAGMEKSNRILEELSFLADILHRPGDIPSGGWPGKREEIDFHFTQAVRNALKIASLSGETERPFTAEDIDRIVDGGHREYLAWLVTPASHKPLCSQIVSK